MGCLCGVAANEHWYSVLTLSQPCTADWFLIIIMTIIIVIITIIICNELSKIMTKFRQLIGIDNPCELSFRSITVHMNTFCFYFNCDTENIKYIQCYTQGLWQRIDQIKNSIELVSLKSQFCTLSLSPWPATSACCVVISFSVTCHFCLLRGYLFLRDLPLLFAAWLSLFPWPATSVCCVVTQPTTSDHINMKYIWGPHVNHMGSPR